MHYLWNFYRQCSKAIIVFSCVFFSYQALADDITIDKARINPTVQGMAVTGVYFTLANNLSDDLVLTHVTGEISASIEVHEHVMREGLMRMRHAKEGISLPAKTVTHFKPGGYHLMVMNLNKTVNEGDVVELVLHFNNGNSKTFNATAMKITTSHQHH